MSALALTREGEKREAADEGIRGFRADVEGKGIQVIAAAAAAAATTTTTDGRKKGWGRLTVTAAGASVPDGESRMKALIRERELQMMREDKKEPVAAPPNYRLPAEGGGGSGGEGGFCFFSFSVSFLNKVNFVIL